MEPFTLRKAGTQPIYSLCKSLYTVLLYTFAIIYASFTIKLGTTNKSLILDAVSKSERSFIFNITMTQKPSFCHISWKGLFVSQCHLSEFFVCIIISRHTLSICVSMISIFQDQSNLIQVQATCNYNLDCKNFEEEYKFFRIAYIIAYVCRPRDFKSSSWNGVSFCSVCREIIAGAPKCEIGSATGRDWAGGMREQESRCP